VSSNRHSFHSFFCFIVYFDSIQQAQQSILKTNRSTEDMFDCALLNCRQGKRRFSSFANRLYCKVISALKPIRAATVLRIGIVPLACLYSFTALNAQSLSAGSDVARPIPGAGHDYIHMLSETVNPSNGSVSINIQLPTENARGFSAHCHAVQLWGS
jgi:hypothetical protein